MSSSPTAPTSTTSSSTSSASAADPRTALVACGALAQPAARPARVAGGPRAHPAATIVERRGWPVDVHPLPPLLHNQPQLIADEVRRLAIDLAETHERVAVAYADCGTYGALDVVCAELG